MGILDGVGLLGGHVGVAGVGGAVPPLDVADAGLGELGGEAVGVGSDVGDQTDGAALDLLTLVEVLGDQLGLLGGVAEGGEALLLEGRGGEGGLGLAGALGDGDIADVEDLGQGLDDVVGLLLALDLEGLAVVGDQLALEGGVAEGAGDDPVVLGDEGLDLLLVVDDEAQGDRLDAAGRAGLDLLLEQGREAEADDAVDDAAALLRVDQVHVDVGGRRLGGFDRPLGDLVELPAGGGGHRQVQDVGQVPGDGFSLAVRVGRQPSSWPP